VLSCLCKGQNTTRTWKVKMYGKNLAPDLAPTFWNWRQNLAPGDFSGSNIFGARAAPGSYTKVRNLSHKICLRSYTKVRNFSYKICLRSLQNCTCKSNALLWEECVNWWWTIHGTNINTRTATSRLKSLNTKKTMTYGVGNPDPG